VKLEVTACDIDKKFPAKTYTITASDGRSISKDLCAEHAEPFEEWLEEADEPEPDADEHAHRVIEQREPEPEPAPAESKRPARKAAAKKTTTSRRRPKIVSLEEIEASKKS
jgi:hypothetical protein